MSARGGLASNRQVLFTAREEEKNTVDNNSIVQQYTDGDKHDYDPLQLEHIIGYAGDSHHTVLSIPTNENLFIKR